MPTSSLPRNLKTLLMPTAMAVGAGLYTWVGYVDFMTPYLIFAMLFIPFCAVESLRELRIRRLHINLLLFQVVVCVLAYLVAKTFDRDIAQGAMICIMAPTATAAVVISAMLGARISTMVTYSLLINVAVALGAPVFFSLIAPDADVPMWRSVLDIFLRIIPVIVLPFAAALLLRRFAPRVADRVKKLQMVSFYIWLLALAIASGQVVSFVVTQDGLTWGKGLWLAGTALVLCVLQFMAGRFIGGRYGESVAGGQALGQKNTILAIWLAQSYLDPVSSIAPAAYILWQNLFNSVQLWTKNRRDQKK